MDITVSKQYEENKSTRLGKFQYFKLDTSPLDVPDRLRKGG